jgi:hypothetical protein
MTKRLVRLIAVQMVLCLIADPIMVSMAPAGTGDAHRPLQFSFTSQALAPQMIDARLPTTGQDEKARIDRSFDPLPAPPAVIAPLSTPSQAGLLEIYRLIHRFLHGSFWPQLRRGKWTWIREKFFSGLFFEHHMHADQDVLERLKNRDLKTIEIRAQYHGTPWGHVIATLPYLLAALRQHWPALQRIDVITEFTELATVLRDPRIHARRPEPGSSVTARQPADLWMDLSWPPVHPPRGQKLAVTGLWSFFWPGVLERIVNSHVGWVSVGGVREWIDTCLNRLGLTPADRHQVLVARGALDRNLIVVSPHGVTNDGLDLRPAWVEILIGLAALPGMRVALDAGGSDKDRTFTEWLQRQVERRSGGAAPFEIWRIGREAFMNRLAGAGMIVTMDSAPANLARLLGVPEVVITTEESRPWFPHPTESIRLVDKDAAQADPLSVIRESEHLLRQSYPPAAGASPESNKAGSVPGPDQDFLRAA